MSVSIQDFGKSTSGQTVKLATLKNDFIEVQLLSYAAIIVPLLLLIAYDLIIIIQKRKNVNRKMRKK